MAGGPFRPSHTGCRMAEGDYVIRVHSSPLDVDANAWDALLHAQPGATPFMRHAYFAALHASGCATAATGWSPQFFTLEWKAQLIAACAVYLKTHSYGEYVFDWAWANAYAQHGLDYYPKAVIAVPFTPVPGTRLLARTAQARDKLLTTLLQWCQERDLSSLHLLFESDADRQVCVQSGMLERHTVQFHWRNTTPGYGDFDAFLASLSQDKRKKIRQERRKVADAGVTFRAIQEPDITPHEWDFFYRCYERTYLEHGNAPYLNRDFFQRMADTMAQHWVLFIAERDGHPIATSLIAVDAHQTRANGRNDTISEHVAYGRYWGALERVDCLHFEACYYQPLQWCIANGYQRFEGGAQGEHKMARALLPVKTTSTHWLAHPAFADAVEQFLAQEKEGVNNYLRQLGDRSPFKNQG
jgi:predicted N-acyltransferase